MGRVYCSSDWHGVGTVADKVLNFLQPDDKLYFLGDATDRGPDGVRLFQALVNDPRVMYIKGNHDEMLARGIYAMYSLHDNEGFLYDWFSNGGNKTADGLSNVTEDEAWKIREKILLMPTEVYYKSPKGHTVILEHAGHSPSPIPCRSHDPLWDRSHFFNPWEGPENWYLVHGHTPVQYLKFEYGYDGREKFTKEDMKYKRIWFKEDSGYIPEVIRYCSGHKFDIDLCTIVSNRIALLDLDTFEVKYFDGED